MGIELELATLLVIQTTFITAFGRFELETPFLKKLSKWLIIDGITIGLYCAFEHWAIIFPFVGLVPGTIYHFMWCEKNGIHPLKATPRKKYYELRKWKWIE
jgi:dolichyl-phosphate-mannose--protein O-mannosyl transferase